ncbi:phosphatidylserine decarboxylase family protein [Chitinophagaceae bacterium MMS25-I14]
MTIHREGYKYIAIATVVFALVAWLNAHFLMGIPVLYWLIQIVFFLLWFWILWFFRIPARTFTSGDNLVIAPADGKVVVIEETVETEYFKDKRLQVSIFMSPLNVHVNRTPISGEVKYMKYHPGKYLVAWHPKSSTENERTTVVVGNKSTTLLMRQIAGALARRICWYVKEGDQLKQNDEFGFIRFGSRVDIYFPVGTKIDVKIGDVVQGGITVLAHLS